MNIERYEIYYSWDSMGTNMKRHEEISEIGEWVKLKDHIQSLSIMELENKKQKADLIEMAEAVILQAGQQDGCPECREWADFNLPIFHRADCTVLKAEKIIKDNN